MVIIYMALSSGERWRLIGYKKHLIVPDSTSSNCNISLQSLAASKLVFAEIYCIIKLWHGYVRQNAIRPKTNHFVPLPSSILLSWYRCSKLAPLFSSDRYYGCGWQQPSLSVFFIAFCQFVLASLYESHHLQCLVISCGLVVLCYATWYIKPSWALSCDRGTMVSFKHSINCLILSRINLVIQYKSFMAHYY